MKGKPEMQVVASFIQKRQHLVIAHAYFILPKLSSFLKYDCMFIGMFICQCFAADASFK